MYQEQVREEKHLKTIKKRQNSYVGLRPHAPCVPGAWDKEYLLSGIYHVSRA